AVPGPNKGPSNRADRTCYGPNAGAHHGSAADLHAATRPLLTLREERGTTSETDALADSHEGRASAAGFEAPVEQAEVAAAARRGGGDAHGLVAAGTLRRDGLPAGIAGRAGHAREEPGERPAQLTHQLAAEHV